METDAGHNAEWITTIMVVFYDCVAVPKRKHMLDEMVVVARAQTKATDVKKEDKLMEAVHMTEPAA